MSHGKERRQLDGSEEVHPLVTYTQGGSIGDVLHILDIAQLFMDPHTVFVVANELGLGVHVIADLESHADFPGILDAETQLEGNLNVIGIHLVTLESRRNRTVFAVGSVLEISTRVGIVDSCIGKIVVARITQTDADGVLLALSQWEIVGQCRAKALVEEAGIPVVGSIELEVIEEVEVDGESIVRFVGDELG